MKRLPLLLVALLLLSSLAPLASAGAVWEKQLGEEITADDERGELVFAGNAAGLLTCYGSAGNQLWTQQFNDSITDIRTTKTGHQLAVTTSDHAGVYLMHGGNGSVWWSETSAGYQYGVTAPSNGSTWYILAQKPGDTTKSYIYALTPTAGKYHTIPALSPTVFSADTDGAWLLARSTTATTLNLIKLSDLGSGSASYPISSLPHPTGIPTTITLSVVPYSASTAQQYIQTIKVHRANGKNTDTLQGDGTRIWDIYVGTLCQANFGDIRFKTSAGDLPYKQVSVSGIVATYEVMLQANTAGTLYIYSTGVAGSIPSNSPLFDPKVITTVGTSTYTVPAGITQINGYIVAGGGGGGASTENYGGGGGGGGGGVVIMNNYAVNPGPAFTVTVGAGGSPGSKGGDSKIGSLIATGGGGGASGGYNGNGVAGGGGGSGGGGGGEGANGVSGGNGGMGTPGMGYAGAAGVDIGGNGYSGSGGGGGGAGGVGSGSNGGPGINVLGATISSGGNGGTGGWNLFGPGSGGKGYTAASGQTGGNGAIIIQYGSRTTTTPPKITTLNPQITGSITATKTYAGDIQRIATAETGDWIGVQTTNRLYLQEITPAGFGTTIDLGARTGTPYDLAIANNGANLIEGRGTLADIFRLDGVQAGTYTTGGPVRAVAIAQKNSLYAAAGSDDGKFYVFSKDATSAWYLFYSSDSEDPVTAIAMSWRGEATVVGRQDGRLTLFTIGDEATETFWYTVYLQRNGQKATGIPVQVMTYKDGDWKPYATGDSDGEGKYVVAVAPGGVYRFDLNDGEHTVDLQMTPYTVSKFISWRAGKTFGSAIDYQVEYSAGDQTLTLTYFDDDGATDSVRWRVFRTDTYEAVYDQTFTGQNDIEEVVPVPDTSTSYKVDAQVSRLNATITNTWFRNPGTPLALPIDSMFSNAICVFFLMLLGGLAGYVHSAKLAVIIAFTLAFFVYVGWMTISWYYVAGAIVVAVVAGFGRSGP